MEHLAIDPATMDHIVRCSDREYRAMQDFALRITPFQENDGIVNWDGFFSFLAAAANRRVIKITSKIEVTEEPFPTLNFSEGGSQ